MNIGVPPNYQPPFATVLSIHFVLICKNNCTTKKFKSLLNSALQIV